MRHRGSHHGADDVAYQGDGRHAVGQIGIGYEGVWRKQPCQPPEMAVLKAIAVRNVSVRRLTTGQISDLILDDEDYLEVLKIGSFDAVSLPEAGVSAAEAAAEGQNGDRLRLGSCPSLVELQWRKHRRAAVKALQGRGIRTRVVTTSGRTRG